MTAMKTVAVMIDSPETYHAETALGGIFLTRDPEQARAYAHGEPMPRGFRAARVAYPVAGADQWCQ